MPFADSLSRPIGAVARGGGGGSTVAGFAWERGPGTYLLTIPVTGKYKFRAWGPGGTGLQANFNNHSNFTGGGSGAYCSKIVDLAAGTQIVVTVGKGAQGSRNGNTTVAPSGPTTVALASGTLTAGAGGMAADGVPGTGGVASGGDININGAAGGPGGAGGVAGKGGKPVSPNSGEPGINTGSGNAGGGASAPGDEYLKGGNGSDGSDTGFGSFTLLPAGTPGGGAGAGRGAGSTATSNGNGGDGWVVVTYEAASTVVPAPVTRRGVIGGFHATQTSSSPVNIPLPKLRKAGDRAFIILAKGWTITVPTGWTALTGFTTSQHHTLLTRLLDGTEADTVQITMSPTSATKTLVFLVEGSADVTPEVAQSTFSSTAAMPVPPISPSWGVSAQTLFLAITWSSGTFALTATPSGYGELMGMIAGEVSGMGISPAFVVSRLATTASEAPSTFTANTSASGEVTLVAIKMK